MSLITGLHLLCGLAAVFAAIAFACTKVGFAVYRKCPVTVPAEPPDPPAVVSIPRWPKPPDLHSPGGPLVFERQVDRPVNFYA